MTTYKIEYRRVAGRWHFSVVSDSGRRLYVRYRNCWVLLPDGPYYAYRFRTRFFGMRKTKKLLKRRLKAERKEYDLKHSEWQ